MKLGIVGLPNVGKSTLFNAITKAKIASENYPFCTIEPNVGIVKVPDERLNKLNEMYKPKSLVYTTIEFCDIAGLVKGASKGEGLGNKFLSHIREAAAIIHVVRCFDDSNIVHVDGSVNPKRDIETINLELILSDSDFIIRQIAKMEKSLKGDKSLQKNLDILRKIESTLNEGKSARTINFDEEELEFVNTLNLISFKPVIYACNIAEDDLLNENENKYLKEVKEFAELENSQVITFCAKIEEDLADLDDNEKEEFLKDLGIKEAGLDKLIKASYKLLDLISFLTVGSDECRAWTIKKGTKAPKAAGKVHSDMEKGFIRAETISFDDLIMCKTMANAKEKGLLRLEGKDYIVKDGDIMVFRFNV